MITSANDERVRDLITQEAADWFVVNRAGLTAKERESFAGWLKASPVHVEECLALSAVTRDLREACAASADSVGAIVARARTDEGARIQPLQPRMLSALTDVFSSRWQTAAVAMAALGIACFGLLFTGAC